MKTKLAVFDIDGTIFRSQLIVELVNGLIKQGIFPKKLNAEVEKDFIAWVKRKGSFESYIDKVVAVYIKNINGVPDKKLKKAIAKILKVEKEKVYVFTRELIKQLKKKDYYLLAISGSPYEIVSEFAKGLGFDSYFGTRFEVINGKQTGKITTDTFYLKADILKSFAEDKKYSLKNSVGVGDSQSDISFLEMVENPIAFNPDKKLSLYAKSKKWRIVVERKNVIYDLKEFKFTS